MSQVLRASALMLLVGLGFHGSALGADLSEFAGAPYAGEPPLPSAPRYFPREGDGPADALPPPRLRRYACAPRRVPIPTNAPDDPSYVGSEYGLSKPSYYGFRPPLGVDDPSGRPLRYCP